jgi:hypothetical protein
VIGGREGKMVFGKAAMSALVAVINQNSAIDALWRDLCSQFSMRQGNPDLGCSRNAIGS